MSPQLRAESVGWTPFMETDFGNILFTLSASRYIRYGALRALPVPLCELGGGQVLQGGVDSAVVVVLKRRIQRLFGLVDVGELPRPDVLFLERLVEGFDVSVLFRRVDVDVFEGDSQRGRR